MSPVKHKKGGKTDYKRGGRQFRKAAISPVRSCLCACMCVCARALCLPKYISSGNAGVSSTALTSWLPEEMWLHHKDEAVVSLAPALLTGTHHTPPMHA